MNFTIQLDLINPRVIDLQMVFCAIANYMLPEHDGYEPDETGEEMVPPIRIRADGKAVFNFCFVPDLFEDVRKTLSGYIFEYSLGRFVAMRSGETIG